MNASLTDHKSIVHKSTIIDPQKQKPEMIIFYNSTKGGVDTLDQKCAIYSILDAHSAGQWRSSTECWMFLQQMRTSLAA
ncbi:unnamed protein product [Parnassius mnemosyne]|uniref:PiggyBac transposable element-derived protein domain-containing protein n=1 Tax=Parnassius mnemosyne TaxID=213953 RepID=A0AAV1K7E6_9NEOP